ncbi:hypothetical protein M2475_000869 [Breznakia sp. PF5-3]|uniref:hypothetical protein n=1 Tax=unclassified Breznakia TaxID=2623764 RepID=UPI0024056984|nr:MULTISPECIES: hypothetical protein [unclassified Breznakia]MDF9824518.1 hypothetical protein [Breznakia sp. PM6-1]MDF9835304.1 hypothetical protein [Breznakia sp. PF5-3]MDF9837020.1 hypothetical protein [Breznakia sp. PFB2-8]MDF9858945.1 hypothetical protein [Breznakia sp. PH5-24]
MKVVSNLELVSSQVTTLQNKKDIACGANNKPTYSNQINITSKNQSISLDNDVFSFLNRIETYLQKDIEKSSKKDKQIHAKFV